MQNYNKRSEVVEGATIVTVESNNEERDHHGNTDDEYFHDSHKETAYHVQLREGMFGDGSDTFDRSAGSNVGVTIHDGSNVSIF